MIELKCHQGIGPKVKGEALVAKAEGAPARLIVHVGVKGRQGQHCLHGCLDGVVAEGALRREPLAPVRSPHAVDVVHDDSGADAVL